MLPWEHLATSGAIFGCHNWGSWILWAEARDVVKHPMMPLNILWCPNNKELLSPEFNSAKTEKAGVKNVNFFTCGTYFSAPLISESCRQSPDLGSSFPSSLASESRMLDWHRLDVLKSLWEGFPAVMGIIRGKTKDKASGISQVILSKKWEGPDRQSYLLHITDTEAGPGNWPLLSRSNERQ